MTHTLDLKGRITDLPYKVYNDVCILLNPHVKNDYRMLAHYMKYDVQDIKTFGLQKNQTDAVLRDWGPKRGSTIGKLIEYLEIMDRSDVIDVLYGR